MVLSVCRSHHIVRHIRSRPLRFSEHIFKTAGCMWTPLGAISMTVQHIRFRFPRCDSRNIFLGPAGCIWTPLGATLMLGGPYFDTLGLHFSGFLEIRARPVEPVGHFGSLCGKRCEKYPKWRSNWSSKWHVFRYMFHTCIILWVVFRELGEDWFLYDLFVTFCGSLESGILI